MVTDHDASVLARRYGLPRWCVIPSLSTAAEPTRRDGQIIDKIGQRASAPSSPSRRSTPSSEAGRTGVGATIYPDLYGDTLGPKGSDGATYLGMMRHNPKVLVKGFACERREHDTPRGRAPLSRAGKWLAVEMCRSSSPRANS
jgi:zinc/manganese transport system substrate-binding protein/manganese/iron transport system substrate-binding protein